MIGLARVELFNFSIFQINVDKSYQIMEHKKASTQKEEM